MIISKINKKKSKKIFWIFFFPLNLFLEYPKGVWLEISRRLCNCVLWRYQKSLYFRCTFFSSIL